MTPPVRSEDYRNKPPAGVNTLNYRLSPGLRKQLIRQMKLITVLLIMALVQAGATGYSQQVTLREKNASVEAVFHAIEKQTGYVFFYDHADLQHQKISINLKNVTLEEALDRCFAKLPLTYKIIGTTIAIKRKERVTPNKDQPGTSSLKIVSPTTSPASAPLSFLHREMTTLPKPVVQRITGRVNDENGESLPGVSILVKGTQQGTTTDGEGRFQIEVPNDNTVLVFSFVGYVSQEVVVGNRTTLNISLEVDQKALEEVVVVGYGTQSKKMLTGAISSVKSEQLTSAPVSNVTNLLAGRLPGLVSKQESGRPGGDAASLNIRGFGSPLVIVDGIQASFSTLDPNTIESVTILKDASAAIYGARAGNGVILVTTKRGSSGKPIIDFKSDWSFQSVTNMPKLVNSGQWAELIREAHLNRGNPESSARFTQEDIDKFYAGTDPDYPNTDWMKVASNKFAPQSQNNLSIRGGNERIRYFGFLGYLNQKTMFKNNGQYERYNIQSNIDAQITKTLSLQLDIAGIVEKRLFSSRDLNNAIWQEYWTSEPFWSPTLPNGEISYGGAGAAIGLHYVSNMDLTGYTSNDKTDLRGSISLEQRIGPIEGLSAKLFANYNQVYTFGKSFSFLSDSWSYNYSNQTYSQWTSKTAPVLSHNNARDRILTGQLSLKYERTFGNRHDISALALYEAIDFSSDWISAQRTDFQTTSLDYLFAGATDRQFNNGSASEMGRQSYVGRINYAFASKYLLEAILRVDESAKFIKNQRRGFFPNVSVGWRLSEEPFFQNSFSRLDNLKLRASYGITGMDEVGNFRFLSGYNYGQRYILGTAPSTGLVTTALPNPYLTWEQMKTYNLGLDLSFLRNLFYAELDFFYRDRDKIPGTRVSSLPTTFGADLPLLNLNRISTRGFELVVGNEGRKGDFRWDVSGNISWNRSRWEYFDEPVFDDEDSERLNKRTGRWTDVAFGYKSEGLFSSQEEIASLDFVYDEGAGNQGVQPGTIRYVDINGDGLLNWRDQVEIGKGTTPRWMGGINLQLNYKQLDFSALLQGAFGFYSDLMSFISNNNPSIPRFSQLVYDERWTPENNRKEGLVPRLGVPYTDMTSDFYYKKADYLRLKTLSIGYNVPASLTQKINLQSARIFLAGVNLFTISGLNKYSIDPEAPSGRGGYYYPQMKTISLGANLSF